MFLQMLLVVAVALGGCSGPMREDYVYSAGLSPSSIEILWPMDRVRLRQATTIRISWRHVLLAESYSVQLSHLDGRALKPLKTWRVKSSRVGDAPIGRSEWTDILVHPGEPGKAIRYTIEIRAFDQQSQMIARTSRAFAVSRD